MVNIHPEIGSGYQLWYLLLQAIFNFAGVHQDVVDLVVEWSRGRAGYHPKGREGVEDFYRSLATRAGVEEGKDAGDGDRAALAGATGGGGGGGAGGGRGKRRGATVGYATILFWWGRRPALVLKKMRNKGVGVAEGTWWDPMAQSLGQVLRHVDPVRTDVRWLVQCTANIAIDAKAEFWAWVNAHYPRFTRPEFDAAWRFDAHSIPLQVAFQQCILAAQRQLPKPAGSGSGASARRGKTSYRASAPSDLVDLVPTERAELERVKGESLATGSEKAKSVNPRPPMHPEPQNPEPSTLKPQPCMQDASEQALQDWGSGPPSDGAKQADNMGLARALDESLKHARDSKAEVNPQLFTRVPKPVCVGGVGWGGGGGGWGICPAVYPPIFDVGFHWAQ